jgi:hypothetical protein
MTTFRDAIGRAATGLPGSQRIDEDSQAAGDDILSMPEMQAISAFVLWVAGQWQYETDRTIAECLMDEGHLPANVVEWVLS